MSRRRRDDPGPAIQGQFGAIELLADADRPGGWLLLIDRVRQSYVDLDHPTYLDFEYVQLFAAVVESLPAGPLTVTHIGGGACSFPRYLEAVRPGSTQLVLEPDGALVELVHARLPLPRHANIRVRVTDGREGLSALRDGSADLVVLDAFAGGRVPAALSTREFVADIARVLRPDGVLLVNVADGPPLTYLRRLTATLRPQFPDTIVVADPSVLRGRRFGNAVLAARRVPLPVADITRSVFRSPFPHRVMHDSAIDAFVAGASVLTDADPLRSNAPPEATWRVGDY